MTREDEIKAGIERSARWWADHGPFVRQSSLERERHHNYKLVYDPAYRARAKLEDQLNRAAVRNMGLAKTTAPTAAPRPRHEAFGELAVIGGKMMRVPDTFEGELPEYREPIAVTLRQYERQTAEKNFADHCEENTGMMMSEPELKKKKQAEKLLRVMSAKIAERLVAAGVNAFREDTFKVMVYWIHTKTVEELPSYRRICLIPYIAGMTRAPKLAALEYFLQENPYCRFWTFTTGPRCLISEGGERLDWAYARLRELNKNLRRRWGVQIVFRTTEFGTLECDESGNRRAESSWGELTRDEQGRVLIHPHLHCVIISTKGYVKPEKWTQMIHFVNEFWRRDGKRVHWDAGKMIQNPRECCKYVVKPGDVLKLSTDELRAFYEMTANRRLVRPMGILAEEIRARKEACRIVSRKRVGGRLRWVEELNHNRLNTETEAEKAERKNLEDAYAMSEECDRLDTAPVCETPLAGWSKEQWEAWDKQSEAFNSHMKPGVSCDVTSVLARIGPAAGPTPFKEPRVLVMTNRAKLNLREVQSHPLVYRLWAQTVENWEAGRALGASAISVHTGTLSGETFQHDLPDFDPPPPLDPICEPFLAFSN